MRMLSREEIAELEKVLGKDFPLIRSARCPWCYKPFTMRRYGGVNCFGYRTQIYYIEVGEHGCVTLETPAEREEKAAVKERAKKTSKKKKIKSNQQASLFANR